MNTETIFDHTTIVILISLVFGISYGIYNEYTSEKFYLRKDQWTCSATSRHYRGKIVSIDCDQWSRK